MTTTATALAMSRTFLRKRRAEILQATCFFTNGVPDKRFLSPQQRNYLREVEELISTLDAAIEEQPSPPVPDVAVAAA